MWCTYATARRRHIHGRGRTYNTSCERFAAARTTGETFSYGERVYNRVGGFFAVVANY